MKSQKLSRKSNVVPIQTSKFDISSFEQIILGRSRINCLSADCVILRPKAKSLVIGYDIMKKVNIKGVRAVNFFESKNLPGFFGIRFAVTGERKVGFNGDKHNPSSKAGVINITPYFLKKKWDVEGSSSVIPYQIIDDMLLLDFNNITILEEEGEE